MLRRAAWLVLALLLVACGGGSEPSAPGPATWEWPDTVTETLTFDDPVAVAYPSKTGEALEAPAVPGQVLVEFRSDVPLSEAVAALASVGAVLLDCVPQRHLVLADVPEGTEGAAIGDLWTTPGVTRALPNFAQDVAADLVAFDACRGARARHGEAVTRILERCAGTATGGPLPTCLHSVGDTAPNAYLTLAAMRALYASTSREVVLNVSLQPSLPKGKVSWAGLDGDERTSYLATYDDDVRLLLADAQALAASGVEVVITLSAGNYGVPLGTVLQNLQGEAETAALLRKHLVIVGVPADIQPSSNSTTYDSEDFVLVDQNLTLEADDWGTSYAAPRLAALVIRTMREQSLSATSALALVKQQARAAGGRIREACNCSTTLRILADTATDDLSTIDSTIAINDVGDIGFTGLDDAGLSRAYVAKADATLLPLGFAPSATRNYGGAALTAASATPPALLVRERVTGSPIGFVLRKWPTDGVSPDVIVGANTSLEGGPAFDSVSLHVDVNDLGLAAFSGLVSGSTETALFGGYQRSAGPPVQPQRLVQFVGVYGMRPAVANTGQIVIQTPVGSIVRYEYPSGASTVLAAAPDFSATGLSPGISSEGDYVAFYGDLTAAGAAALALTNSPGAPTLAPGPGIFLSLATPSGRDVVRIAGLDAEFTAFTPSLRVAVRSHGAVLATVCYGATRSGKPGVYLKSVSRSAKFPGIGVSSPCEVLEAGDEIYEDADGNGRYDAGEVRLAGTVADIGFQHPLSKTGKEEIGLWVRMTTGEQTVVRAQVAR